MKLFAPEHAGKHVWQVADAKTRSVSYTANNSTSPPPDAVHGHPLGKYDSDGLYWSNAGLSRKKSGVAWTRLVLTKKRSFDDVSS
jgi:hypothetical protein